MKHTGFALIVAGIAGVAFFWLTDPQYGPIHGLRSVENAIEASRQTIVGTVVGSVGSLVLLLEGTWLMVRRESRPVR